MAAGVPQTAMGRLGAQVQAQNTMALVMSQMVAEQKVTNRLLWALLDEQQRAEFQALQQQHGN